MDDGEVLALIRGPEGERVERKERLQTKKDAVCQAICAFANDFPKSGRAGIVVIGQADDGKPAGIQVTEELLNELADLRTNGDIFPFPQISVRRLELDGVAIAVVVIEPSASPPVRFKGRTWIRVGPSTRPATAAEEAALTERRQAANLPSTLGRCRRPPSTTSTLSDSRRNSFPSWSRKTFSTRTVGRSSNSSRRCVSSCP